MVYSPDRFPVVSKLVGNVCLRAITSLTSVVERWSCALHGPEKGVQAVYGLKKG